MTRAPMSGTLYVRIPLAIKAELLDRAERAGVSLSAAAAEYLRRGLDLPPSPSVAELLDRPPSPP